MSNTNRAPDTEWTFSFEMLETLGENVAQIMQELGIGEDADLQTHYLHADAPTASTDRAKVRIDFTVGYASITALPKGSDQLLEADVVSIGAVELLKTHENGTPSLHLRQKRRTNDDLLKPVKDAVDTVARSPELRWDVRLSPELLLEIMINAGVTVDHLDLTGLKVPRLTFNGGTGKTDIHLPAMATHAVVHGGVGVLDITVPDNAKATLDMDLGAGSTFININHANVKANIEGGVGNCLITVPEDVALRVEANSGLGNIDVPENCQPVELESDYISESGMWQTTGFSEAPQKIDIRYEGGVGSLIVRTTGSQHER